MCLDPWNDDMRRKICSFLKEMSVWGARNSLEIGKISEAQYENQKSSIAMFLFSRQILCQDPCRTLGGSYDTTETVKVDGKLKKE